MRLAGVASSWLKNSKDKFELPESLLVIVLYVCRMGGEKRDCYFFL